jgi:hypothetical protein
VATWARECYDNHPPLMDELDATQVKLTIEEKNSFFMCCSLTSLSTLSSVCTFHPS